MTDRVLDQVQAGYASVAASNLSRDEMFAGLNAPPPPAFAAAPEQAADESKTPIKSAVLERFRSRGGSTIIGRSPLVPRPDEGSHPGLPANGQKTDGHMT